MEPAQGSSLLSQQELLDLLGAGVRWEAQPNLDKVTIEHDGEATELSKSYAIAKLQGDQRLNLQDKPREYFDKPGSWADIRSAINGVLSEEFKNTQPDELRLQALEKQYEETLVKRGVPLDQAKLLAKRFARSGGEMANQEPKTTTSGTRTMPQSSTTPAQQTEGLRPTTQETMANIEERAAAGGFRWTDYPRHPIWALNQVVVYTKTYVTTLFKKGFSEAGKAAKEATVKVAKETAEKAGIKIVKKIGEKAIKEGAKTIATEVATDATEAALAAAPTGVTQAIAVAMEVAKRIWQAAKILWNLLPSEVKEFLKKMAGGLTLGLVFLLQYLMAHLVATTMAAAALVLGGPLGWALAPTAFMLGLGLEGIVVSTFSAISTAGVAAVSIATQVTLGTLIAGTSIAAFSLAAIFAPLLIGSLAILAVITTPPESEGPPVLFTLVETVDKQTLPNDSNDSVTYSLTIVNEAEQAIQISFQAKENLQKNQTINLPLPEEEAAWPSQLQPGENVTILYKPYLVKADFNDADLVHIVTVAASVTGDEGQQETQTVSAMTRIGSPPVNNDQPFGFPAGGTIIRFEDEPKHKGTLFDANGNRYWAVGGIDILGSGGTPVYSTLTGKVVYSNFDMGDSRYTEKTCTNIGAAPIGNPFYNCAVGGAVMIQNGNYLASFIHLAREGLVASGTTVSRGQQIGVTYGGENGPLPTVSGWHVHYQVLLNGANVPFGSEANAPDALCSPYKILPFVAVRQVTVSQDGTGPFTCQDASAE